MRGSRRICFLQSAKAVIGLGLPKVTVSDLRLLVIVGSLRTYDTFMRVFITRSVWGCEQNRSDVTSFRCLTAIPPEGNTRAGILPGYPSLYRRSRETEVGFEPRNFRSVNSRSNHLGHLAQVHVIEIMALAIFITRSVWGCKQNRSDVTSFRCLTAIPPEGNPRAGILPGYPSLYRRSRDTEVRFEARTFRSVNSRSGH
ncbi:hypothetical protein T265_05204 [Opisthorchis viverrini]|uniref:Uncharacterized protein n=1 Tax=Opisthorchis viverrini TaxID=6198 RepID=A0A074ZWX5_OPIVI|nr:hypothetical protein T265_05204 [Opisthorchis viverrini]KER27850.1 hypothetical protein T265_05204 [Opisthorchis viverrini]